MHVHGLEGATTKGWNTPTKTQDMDFVGYRSDNNSPQAGTESLNCF